MVGSERRAGPGVSKVREVRLVTRRSIELVSLRDGLLSALIDDADVVSEGQSLVEGADSVYYGTTSVLLAAARLPAGELATIAAALAKDPHARVRILRIAQREAGARAGGAIGTVSAELAVGVTPRGVLVSIEVSATLRKARKTTANPQGD